MFCLLFGLLCESQEEICITAYVTATKEAGLVMASLLHGLILGAVMASWLVCLPLDRGLCLSPGRGTSCCVLGQETTLTVPLSTQVYKWVLATLMLGVTL